MFYQSLRKYVVTAALLTGGIPAVGFAQTGVISGTVVDSGNGQPIPTAQVYLQGTSRNALTSATGTFTLTGVPAGTYTIVAQRIGYQQSTQGGVVVGATGTASVTVRMAPAALALQAVVATGLIDPVEGVRSPISVAKVSAETMPVVAAGNAVQNIQGRVAGVQMNRGSGEPGSSTSIVLRTPTSLRGGGAPLIVVDGVVLSSTPTGVASTSAIDGLDIESMEVIRGAAAASMYGSRAAAGVIAITTKRGTNLQQGQTQFSLHTEVGLTETFSLDMTNHTPYALNAAGTDYILASGADLSTSTSTTRRNNRAYPDRGVSNYISAIRLNAGGTKLDTIYRSANTDPAVQFYDQPFAGGIVYNNLATATRPGIYQSHNFTISQNTLGTNFSVSVNRVGDQGVVEGSDGYYRNSLRLNLDHRFKETMSLGVSMSHARDGRDEVYTAPAQSFFTAVLYTPRDLDLSLKDNEGNFLQRPDPFIAYQNPLWSQNSRTQEMTQNRTLLSGNYSWSPVLWLSGNARLSYDRREQNTTSYLPQGTPIDIGTGNTRSYDGMIDFADNWNNTFNGEAQLSARKDFGALNTRVTVRGLMERDERATASRRGQGFNVAGVPSLSAVSAAGQTAGNNITEVRSSGYLTDIGLDYAGKYTLTALGRRDGSSLFGSGQRWQNYYRTAAAWRMGEEEWFNLPHVSEFKLSFARGTAGGRPAFANQYEVWSSGESPTKQQLGNPDLRPSRTTENEVSLNAILFTRFGLTLTQAWQKTVDQIVPNYLPAPWGYDSRIINSGAVAGHTTEFSLEGNIFQTPKVGWNSLMTADFSRVKIVEWTLPCDASQTYRFDCQGEPVYGTYGFRNLTSLNDLKDHRGGRAVGFENQFQVNDEGLLVWVGTKKWNEGIINGIVQDSTWGFIGTVNGDEYEWGMPIFQQDEMNGDIRQNLGESMPKNLGWINNVRYGNWNFSAQLHAAVGAVANNRAKLDMMSNTNGERNHVELDQFGKPDGLKKPIKYYTVAVGSGGSSYIVEKADYLKLRTAQVGYRFNRAQFERWGLGSLGISSAQIGLTGRNLFTITGFSGFDPEQGLDLNTRANSVDSSSYPPTRTWTVDATLTF
ncbi:MAG: SusC/RagA family TonB-linked outer membrane protein [Gemmatimonadota bacterium]|jgi:TonB-linked SusC/RagA family outer membrane protein|nr:SusC/RagA family TonB-linked outer membrane protein [Gemmatimonadota bacterium]